MRRVIACLAAIASIAVAASASSGAIAHEKETFRLVGHSPLSSRGMNAALAVWGDYAYVGSRTDGKANNANGAGVLVVDVSDPSAPEVVHEIGLPHQGNQGETSREMRIWPQQKLLIVMNLGSNCSFLIHACSPVRVADNYRFYDISGKHAAKPKLVSEYKPSEDPHEFFLWVDPERPKQRALMFQSTPSAAARILVTDISNARRGKFKEIATWGSTAPAYAHSMSLSNDGERMYIAHNEGGFLVADTSEVVDGDAKPQIRTLTQPVKAPDWDGPGALHSTAKLFGKDYVLTTDEAYGDLLRPLGSGGCPWGWSRIIDVSDEAEPEVVAQYKIEQNRQEFCTTDPPRPSSSYSAHNPTLTKRLAFISWHSGGLQAVDISDPRKPRHAGAFVPPPLPFVVQEDPALSAGQDKVVMWSFPIVKDGLIYVVDVRNGLYIVKYKGKFAGEVAGVDFIEGNSNLLDALSFEKP